MARQDMFVGTSSWYIGQFVYPFVIVAVDVFVLISGYFGIKLKVSKLLRLNTMVTFYSVALLLLAIYCLDYSFHPRKDWMYLFPVLTKKYWFITIYFGLCLCSPWLNKLVDYLSAKDFMALLKVFFGLFVLLPTLGFVLNFPSVTEDAGYGLANFCFLYLVGRFIRLHLHLCYNRKVYLFVYIFTMLALGCFQVVYSKILGFHFTALLSYDTLFVFVGSVALFLYFKELQFRSIWINKLATCSLAVYVLHLHPLTFEWLFSNVLQVKEYQGWLYLACLFLVPVPIYLICFLIETVRKSLWKMVGLSDS